MQLAAIVLPTDRPERETCTLLELWYALTMEANTVATETPSETTLDLAAHYRVSGYGAIAWYLLGYVKVRDEDYWWSGCEYDDTDRVRAVMVGDDRVFEFGVDELEQIGETEFCRGCGQIGCGCEVWE